MFKMTLIALSAGLSLSTAALACDEPAAHQETAPKSAKRTSTKASKPTGVAADAAVIAAVDPVTGQLRAPTSDELQQLQQQQVQQQAQSAGRRTAQGLRSARSVSAPAPRVMQLSNGAEGIDATEEQMSHSVAGVQTDGSVAKICVEGPKAAREYVKKGIKPKLAAEKE